ncbi:hypothetical protein [Rhizobium sp. Leaf384]|uniref:hypothetical protein n=1 Tax=Rhizobium sp. Leaf384 TaxID=1736358 RepID=UPI000A8E6BD9|nr:hypothetical protein [Rhizobium sp. Leaf384]
MDIAAAVKMITDRADAMERRKALNFLERNIKHHEQLCLQISRRRVYPVGWTYAAHTDLIAMLISAQTERRNAKVAA